MEPCHSAESPCSVYYPLSLQCSSQRSTTQTQTKLFGINRKAHSQCVTLSWKSSFLQAFVYALTDKIAIFSVDNSTCMPQMKCASQNKEPIDCQELVRLSFSSPRGNSEKTGCVNISYMRESWWLRDSSSINYSLLS